MWSFDLGRYGEGGVRGGNIICVQGREGGELAHPEEEEVDVNLKEQISSKS